MLILIQLSQVFGFVLRLNWFLALISRLHPFWFFKHELEILQLKSSITNQSLDNLLSYGELICFFKNHESNSAIFTSAIACRMDIINWYFGPFKVQYSYHSFFIINHDVILTTRWWSCLHFESLSKFNCTDFIQRQTKKLIDFIPNIPNALLVL